MIPINEIKYLNRETYLKDNWLQAKIANKLGKKNATIYRWAINENHKLLTAPAVLEVISDHRQEEIHKFTTQVK